MARPYVLACAALAKELRSVLDEQGLADAVDVDYLPAPLHNRPDRIVPEVEERLRAIADDRPVLLGYGDCGTGGEIDRLIERSDHDVSRLPGDHCYAFLSGVDRFAELHADELGTFFLTDFLAKHFDALVWSGLGLDRHPELRDMYFGAYRRIVLLTQTGEESVVIAARRAAEMLGLTLELEHTGLEPLAVGVRVAIGERAT